MSAQPTTAPVLSGPVPPLAAGFNSRQETGFRLADALRPGETILLVPAQGGDPDDGPTAARNAAGGASGASAAEGVGGTGKTQLAVGFARQMWSTRAVDVLVWVAAGNRTAIVAGYARAAADLHLADGPGAVGTSGATSASAGETADDGAQRFLDWLRRTQRRWAVVLDGVASPVDLDGLWPEGPAGQVVVTSRLRAQELADPGARRTAYAVPGFSRREAVAYLNTRLVSFPDQRIEALDLAEDIEGMPLAIAQAASVIAVAEGTCREYRDEYAQRRRSNPQTAIDGCPQSLVATWSLAVEYAHELPPAGLAWPALAFAAMLDTNGIPAAVLTSPAACVYITGRPEVGSAEQTLVKSAYATLERLGLASVDTGSTIRTVWLHSSVRACVRAYLTPASIDQVVQAAASALVEAWPPTAESADLSQALRDCTAALHAFAGDLLWKPEAHPALVRAGLSLMEAPVLADAAIRYWQAMSGAAGHLLGPGHAQSVLARGQLADAYAAAGRHGEALAATEAALADRVRTLGPEHPLAVAARVNAARSLEAADRTDPGDRALRAGPGVARADVRHGAPGDAGGPGAARRRVLGVRAARRQHQALRAEPGPTPNGRWGRCTPTRWRRAPAWPPPTWRRARAARRSRPTSGRWPTASGRAGPTTWRRWRCGRSSRTPTGAAGSSRTRSASTNGCWPTGRGCSARITWTRSAPAPAWPTPTGRPGG